MDYRLKIGDEEYAVSAEQGEKGKLEFSMGGKNHSIAYNIIDDRRVHITIDGRGYNAYVYNGENEKSIYINGTTYYVVDMDALEQAGSRKKGGDNLPNMITPKMPSVVVTVLVKVGDEVSKGQGVIVLSAMKMETTLGAPHDGKVTAINAADGDKVMPGEILVEIEAAESD